MRIAVALVLSVGVLCACPQPREPLSSADGGTAAKLHGGEHTPWERRAEAILRARLGTNADPRVFDDRSNPLRPIDAPFCPPVSLRLTGDLARLAELVAAVRSSTSTLRCSEVCLENESGSDRLCSTGVLTAPYIPR